MQLRFLAALTISNRKDATKYVEIQKGSAYHEISTFNNASQTCWVFLLYSNIKQMVIHNKKGAVDGTAATT
jgi:hypothetical protein